jgi:hypothetical protein
MATEKRTINNYVLIGLCSLLFVIASCGAEEVEVPTDGRLTITGLDAYNGKKIFAVRDNRTGLYAYGSCTNNGSIPAQIASGQATLKVYKSVDFGRTIGTYNGSDQYITFNVAIVGTVYGYVTVNFINGIAEGVFVPDK